MNYDGTYSDDDDMKYPSKKSQYLNIMPWDYKKYLEYNKTTNEIRIFSKTHNLCLVFDFTYFYSTYSEQIKKGETLYLQNGYVIDSFYIHQMMTAYNMTILDDRNE